MRDQEEEERARPGRRTEVLTVRISPDLLRALREKSKDLDTDLSSFVRWCLVTGIYLGDLNTFVRTRLREES